MPGKPRGGSWKKGQSGNPGGRPKIIGEVRDLARAYTQEAVEALARIMRAPESPAAAVVSAATSLLDRGWGKPSQDINATIRKTIGEFTDEELAAIVGGAASEDGISVTAESADGADPVHSVH